MGFVTGVLAGALVMFLCFVPIIRWFLREVNRLKDHSEDKYDTRGKYN
jgi:hypothetical protein